jgi:cephalosporin hydroxylase
VIVETGVAHGGGLVFYASLLKLIGAGRVIGIDIEVRPHNRAAIEAHELSPWITLIEGSSIDPTTLENLKELLRPDEKTLVVLDSKHSYDHVTAELERYAPLVGVGSYVVVCDGIMEQVAGGPRTQADWTTDNPRRAVIDFAARNKNFAIREPAWRFNEGLVSERVSYWPDAYLLRIA